MASAASTKPNDGYILGRDAAANLRINMQHYLWIDGGFILHPKIPTDVENMRVAEIGCGTGIWLTQASRILPASARLDGFDVSLDAAPPQEWMPANVTLHERDMLQPIPDELVGKYDIVHIKLFLAVLWGKEPDPVLKNFLKLLKPGGWISWGEYDFSLLHQVSTSDATTDGKALFEQYEYAGTLGGTKPSWTATHWPRELPQSFAKNGLINISVDNRLLPPELLVYHLDTSVIACTEMMDKVLNKMDGNQSDVMKNIVERVSAGRKEICNNYGRLTVIGQKRIPKE